MKNFKLWNTVCGWVAFAIAAVTYLMTIEPTASFWDCGEFISSATKLDVGHPPGAPFFMLMGHFASLFASDSSHIAMCVNALSAIASAFTILFLFWTITALAKKLVVETEADGRTEKPMQLWQAIAVLGAGMVGSLVYTFSDTFWFSAVEGEVYASSSLFTAVVFWLILKWDEKAEEEGSDKWLILIAYLMGLSIGVHLLNLLTIPAIVLVYYFRKYDFSWKGFLLAFLASVAILAAVLYGLIPGSVQMMCWAELLFVNGLHLPYNTGVAVYLVLLVAALAWAIYETSSYKNPIRANIAFILSVALAGIPFFFESVWIGLCLLAVLAFVLFYQKKQPLLQKVQNQNNNLSVQQRGRFLNTATIMIAVMLIGYSSYAAIVIRSSADTPMDQNSPDNVFSLKYYLNREQYGDRPLLYGPSYNAPVQLQEDRAKGICTPVEKIGHAQYAPSPIEGETKYIVTGYKTSYQMQSEFMMLFPRMYSADGRHKQAYKEWGEVKGRRVKYEYCGQQKVEYKPTFAENMRFFFSYQCNYMYWRYFMWNFAGRQNDLQGYGEINKGNWLSGIPFLDNLRLGDQSALPAELRENKGHNVYYMLPLLLGLIGIVYQLVKRKNGSNEAGLQNFTLTFLLFFLTGLAIVVYLNQTPYQPRERDYAYAGSFYAFSIWVGLGVLGLVELINKYLEDKSARLAVAIGLSVVSLGVPALMAEQNWDDHDRSDRYTCRDFGANYLRSCQTDGIIFSNGDNDTFPLWYNQEVEGVGEDLRVCNLSYLQTDWYIDQMKRPYYTSSALPISWEKKDYVTGKNDVVWIENRSSMPMSVAEAFKFVRNDDPRTKRDGENFIPTNDIYVPVTAQSEQNFLLSNDKPKDAVLADKLSFRQSRRLTKSEMMVMEMISTNNFKRPMYFAVTVGNDYYLGLEKYFELTGLAYHITPYESADGEPRVNTELMYDNMMHKFRYGNINKEGIYIDENLMRMCRTHRMMFSYLAEALVKEGDKTRAIEVLDFAEEQLPGYNVPYDYTSATMANLYYACGEKDKANQIMSKVADNDVDYLRWGASAGKEVRKQMQQTLGHHLAVLGYVLQSLERQRETELFEKYYEEYKQYVMLYR